MPDSGSIQRHPFVSLILLLSLIFAGAVIFTFIGAAIAGIIYGLSDLLKVFAGDLTANLAITKVIQISASVGMFVMPALLFARIESRNWRDYLKLNPFLPLFFLLTVLLMIFSVPLLEWTVELNKSMKLPGFLQGVEEWMRLKEDQTAEVTRQLLTMNTTGALLVNLLMLAVIPAIGEELIFRGCLQRLFGQLTNNYHIAIWVTAITFSAIHMQFFGFIPRMLLGAMFGYLLVWSNSLWLPILAHFINNATAVITAFIYQQQGKSLEQLDQPAQSSWLMYLASLALTISMLWYFYQRSKTQAEIISE